MTLFLDGRKALSCPTCEGDGELAERGCAHEGNCPCGPEYRTCPTCLGGGVQICLVCGAANAVAEGEFGPACVRCLSGAGRAAPAVETRTAPERRDRGGLVAADGGAYAAPAALSRTIDPRVCA